MTTLTVSDFSCLSDATFVLAPINVIIGPQGSGKSVTTKLFYFFSQILPGFSQYAERGESLESYKRHLTTQFGVWFPPSAWGKGRFNITYSSGLFSVRILRRTTKRGVIDEVSISFCEWFSALYASAVKQYN